MITVHAGFPSPAKDFESPALDLQSFLVHHPLSTYIMRVKGDSMQGAGIFSGDYVLVDRSLVPTSGKVVVAVVDGGFTIKRYVHQGGLPFLASENSKYSTRTLGQDDTIWGVVTYVLHKP